MTYSYTAYGLTLRLPFPCPALIAAPADAAPDVIVTEGPVPRHLAAPVAEDGAWQAEPGRFLLRAGRRAGRFLVEGGERVTLERNPAAEAEVLNRHFLDSVLAAVLRQRGLLVLHANAAATPTGAVAIAGPSGAGKSTTLAALLGHGCSMLSDDVTALRMARTGTVEVLPGVPHLYLCADAAEELGHDHARLPRSIWRREKAAISARAALMRTPAPLRALYLLAIHAGADLHARQLSGADRFAALQECVYGPLLPDEHGGQFPLFAAVASQVAVTRIERPAGRWTADAIARAILHG